MAVGLKGKVVRGVAWNVAEKVASGLFQAWVTVNVLNRLVPDDTAVVAILAVFVAVFNTFVDSGFSQALIRKKTPAAVDFSSVFWFNIAVAVAIYALLVGLSYPTSRLLAMPDLVRFAPVFFLIVPFGAMGIIQQTVLTREFDFRTMSAITFVSVVGAGVVAVALAFAGFGVWALVGQRVSITLLRILLLWIFGRWKPSIRFSAASIREMLGYSSRLLGADFLNNLYNSIPQLLIGRIHRGTLGVYDTARKVRDLPVVSVMNALQGVTFPALAAMSDDDDKFAKGVSKVIGAIVFLMYPVMAGLIAVSSELFGTFLKADWQAAVPFFRILCLAGFATPLAIVSSNILRTRTDGGRVLRAEIVKKVFATVILAATIPFGALAISWGVVGIAFTDAAVSIVATRRLSSYGFGALARDVLPVLALAVVMAVVVWGAGEMLPTETAVWMVLAVKILVGVSVYLGGAALLRLDALREFTGMLAKVVGTTRG